MRYLIADHVSY